MSRVSVFPSEVFTIYEPTHFPIGLSRNVINYSPILRAGTLFEGDLLNLCLAESVIFSLRAIFIAFMCLHLQVAALVLLK